MCVPRRLQWRVERIMRSRRSECSHRIPEEPGSTPQPPPDPSQPEPLPKSGRPLRRRPRSAPVAIRRRSALLPLSQLRALDSFARAQAEHAAQDDSDELIGNPPRLRKCPPHSSPGWPVRRPFPRRGCPFPWPQPPQPRRLFGQTHGLLASDGLCPPRHRAYHACPQSRVFWSSWRHRGLGDLLSWPAATVMCVPLQLVERVEAILARSAGGPPC
jgi:hypothetical protein